jgi:hypothetical protein
MIWCWRTRDRIVASTLQGDFGTNFILICYASLLSQAWVTGLVSGKAEAAERSSVSWGAMPAVDKSWGGEEVSTGGRRAEEAWDTRHLRTLLCEIGRGEQTCESSWAWGYGLWYMATPTWGAMHFPTVLFRNLPIRYDSCFKGSYECICYLLIVVSIDELGIDSINGFQKGMPRLHPKLEGEEPEYYCGDICKMEVSSYYKTLW